MLWDSEPFQNMREDVIFPIFLKKKLTFQIFFTFSLMGADAPIPPRRMFRRPRRGAPAAASRLNFFFLFPSSVLMTTPKMERKPPCPARPRRGGRATPEGGGTHRNDVENLKDVYDPERFFFIKKREGYFLYQIFFRAKNSAKYFSYPHICH